MKTVGIILRQWNSRYKDIPLYGLRRDLIKYLSYFKDINVVAIPVVFEEYDDINEEFERIKNIISICDGIIFPGGAGIFELDYKIIEFLREIDKPTLGICLGMQAISSTFNGNVVSHFEDISYHDRNDKYVHDVRIEKNSKLYEILGSDKIKVNSRHKCYIEDTTLEKVAYSIEDNILEAVEDSSKKFFIAVQWHPESILDDANSKKLFNAYIKSL